MCETSTPGGGEEWETPTNGMICFEVTLYLIFTPFLRCSLQGEVGVYPSDIVAVNVLMKMICPHLDCKHTW